MGTISYVVPQAGTDLNSLADPEIATALNTIKTWANGNVDSSNLSATAGILRSQLAGALGGLAYTTVSTNTSLVDGKLYQVAAAGVVLTLPAPASNATIGIWNGAGTGPSPATVSVSSGAIFGAGLAGGGASSFALGAAGAAVVLVGNGSNWLIVAGQQDTGWVGVTVASGVTQWGSGYPASCRLRGDVVQLKGGLTTTGGSVSTWATIPTGFRPTQSLFPPGASITLGSPSYIGLTIATSGLITSSGSAGTITLDSIVYTLS